MGLSNNAYVDLLAERDRLAAENAELREERDAAVEFAHAAEREFCAANATLDALREVLNKWMAFDGFTAYDAIGDIRTILYPKETDNG